jgi:hypothetical protein
MYWFKTLQWLLVFLKVKIKDSRVAYRILQDLVSYFVSLRQPQHPSVHSTAPMLVPTTSIPAPIDQALFGL